MEFQVKYNPFMIVQLCFYSRNCSFDGDDTITNIRRTPSNQQVIVEHSDEADEVSKKGHNWDAILRGVLLPYRSTYLTTSIYRDITFYLLYDCDPNCKLPSGLDFQATVSKFPAIES